MLSGIETTTFVSEEQTWGHEAVPGRGGDAFTKRLSSLDDLVQHIAVHDLDGNKQRTNEVQVNK